MTPMNAGSGMGDQNDGLGGDAFAAATETQFFGGCRFDGHTTGITIQMTD